MSVLIRHIRVNRDGVTNASFSLSLVKKQGIPSVRCSIELLISGINFPQPIIDLTGTNGLKIQLDVNAIRF